MHEIRELWSLVMLMTTNYGEAERSWRRCGRKVGWTACLPHSRRPLPLPTEELPREEDREPGPDRRSLAGSGGRLCGAFVTLCSYSMLCYSSSLVTSSLEITRCTCNPDYLSLCKSIHASGARAGLFPRMSSGSLEPRSLKDVSLRNRSAFSYPTSSPGRLQTRRVSMAILTSIPINRYLVSDTGTKRTSWQVWMLLESGLQHFRVCHMRKYPMAFLNSPIIGRGKFRCVRPTAVSSHLQVRQHTR